MSRRVVPCVGCGRQIQIGKRIEASILRDEDRYVCDSCCEATGSGYDGRAAQRTRTIQARELSDTECKDCGVWLKWSDVEHGLTTCATCAAERRAAR